jgi:predicted metal-dependent phosphoesterase TrpH
MEFKMVKVEFHCHTRFSKDSLVDFPDLLHTCDRKGIQKLFVTDHDTIAGALRAVEFAPDRFLVGEEIMTRQGELLAFFVNEEIPSGLSAEEAIERLRSQGAFISVSHPFDSLRSGHWDEPDLIRITPLIDAIEVFNSRCLLPRFNTTARIYAQHHHLLETVGSDAHSASEVGGATLTLLEFHDAISLKHSLSIARLHTRLSPPWVHFYSRYAAWRKRKS